MELIKIGEVAQRVGVSPSTVRLWVKQGILPCQLTPNGHRRFDVEDVAKLVEDMKRSGEQESKKQ